VFSLYGRIFNRHRAETLNEFLDTLNRDESSTIGSRGLLGEPGSDLAELFRLAHRVKAEMAPTDPSPFFESNLRLRLLAAVSQSDTATELSVATWRQPRFIIGAATVGSLVSAAAVIAFFVRIRAHANARAVA
jgi:hypothetical protein